MDKSALEIIEENESVRQAQAATKPEAKANKKRPLSERLKGVELLATRWHHNPMQMNYDAMRITSDELK